MTIDVLEGILQKKFDLFVDDVEKPEEVIRLRKTLRLVQTSAKMNIVETVSPAKHIRAYV